MAEAHAQSVLLTPNIPTGGRTILPKGRKTGGILLWMSVVPALAFIIAAVDTRIGFQLLMASSGIAMLVLIVGLQVRLRGLRAGAVRLDASGVLRFVPPRSQWLALVAVPTAFLMPVIAIVLIGVLHLPTQMFSSRLLQAAPFLLAAVALGALAQMAWSMRFPRGLRVGVEGLSGVRGSRRVEVGWDDILNVSLVGPFGPKLMLLIREGRPIVIDAHHLGSDPAIVAAVIEFFRTRPFLRAQLSDGPAAIRAVEAVVGVATD